MTLNWATRDLGKPRFYVKLATKFFAAIGFFSVVFGLYFAIYPDGLKTVRTDLSAAVLLISLIFAVYGAWPRLVQETYRTPNTEIRVVEGDLFEQEGNIVVGMADTFDTEVPHIISERSVQGQFLAKVYRNDRTALDSDLHRALARYTASPKFSEGQRALGNMQAYPIGTVASIQNPMRKFFFCLAYTEMNERHEAQATVDGIWRSLNCLWNEVRSRSNGDPVSIAVIGGGQARISQHLPAQDSIRLIALSYVFASREEKVCDRLSIIVRPQDVADLDMFELQTFLKSLRAS